MTKESIYLIPESLKTPIATLRDHFLLLSRRGKKTNRLVGIASIRGGEGTTTIASNLALSLSKFREAKILLVDANLHNPALHKIFKTPQNPGLVEGMEENKYKTYPVSPGLTLLPSGKPSPDYIPPYETQAFVNTLNTWKAQNTFTLFDIPPLLQGGDGLRLVAALDTVLLVVQNEKTKQEEAAKVKESILRAGTAIAGVVLNKQTPSPNFL